MRTAEIVRKTAETDISVLLDIDGRGGCVTDSGCGFLDHMLTLFARHGRFDLSVKCVGDTQVDYHHTVEDIGICLGQAFRKALGSKAGIKRYGDIILPMDEALILAAVDISGRGGFYSETAMMSTRVGDFDTELFEEFFVAFTRESGITLHVRQLAGRNTHHIIEGAFKAVARSLSAACEIDQRFASEIPSTKGTL